MRRFIGLLSLVLLFFSSCGGNKNEKEDIRLKPASTNVSGQLGKCFTVVDREYKATGSWGLGVISVELQRTNETLPFVLGGRELISYNVSTYEPNVQVGFGIEFLDSEGNVLDKVSANANGFSGSYDPDEAVELVNLNPGEVGTIRFSVNNDAKDAVAFRISSSYKENGDAKPTNDNISVTMKGYVYRYPITMSLDVESTKVTGEYYYDKNGPGATLKLSGTNSNGTLDIYETNEKDALTGHFVGDFDGDEFSGEFIDMKGKHMYFKVSEDGAEPQEKYEEDSTEEYSSSSSSSSSDGNNNWDAILDEYDEYVTQYISVLKKSKSGDLSALTESLKLQEKAISLGEKLQNAQGQLSPSQQQRYLRIMQKMASGIQ